MCDYSSTIKLAYFPVGFCAIIIVLCSSANFKCISGNNVFVYAAVSTTNVFPKTRGMLFINGSKLVEINTWQSLSGSFPLFFQEEWQVIVGK